MQKCNFVTRIVLAMSLAFSSQVFAADTDGLANILKKNRWAGLHPTPKPSAVFF